MKIKNAPTLKLKPPSETSTEKNFTRKSKNGRITSIKSILYPLKTLYIRNPPHRKQPLIASSKLQDGRKEKHESIRPTIASNNSANLIVNSINYPFIIPNNAPITNNTNEIPSTPKTQGGNSFKRAPKPLETFETS